MSKHRLGQSGDEAAWWWTAMHDGALSRADREQFVDWLRASPEHVAEYLELADLWEDLGDLGGDADVQEILAEAREAGNVVSLTSPVHTASLPTLRSRKLFVWRMAAAGALVVLTGALFLLQLRSEPITTTVGEQRSITLADGSIIALNTRTSIRYEYDAGVRRVELIDGEALFDVAHDESRPFIVTAGVSEVRVLGTSFNIYKQSEVEATVTVLEGRISVRAPGLAVIERTVAATEGKQPGEPAEVELTGGQQIHIQPQESVAPVKRVSPERVAEWTTRRITFEDTPLSDVVAQFNRYSDRPLRVDDPELATIHLNGVFEPHSQEDLLEYLRKAEGVRVRRVGHARVISR